MRFLFDFDAGSKVRYVLRFTYLTRGKEVVRLL